MKLTTDGLIIREHNALRDSDRFLTVLTRDHGVIRVSVRGARQLKNRNASATQLLCYSRLTLYKGRDTYTVDDAEPLRVFFEVRENLEKLALAQYFCELAAVLCPAEESAEEELRLLLNALHFLAEDSRPQAHIKAVTELRLLCCAGYMPAVDRCAVCGCTEFTRFSPLRGVAFCEACNSDAASIPLNGGAWAAMRHVVSAPFEKCFSFTVSDEALALFADAVERFLLAQLNRGFLTLDFYKSLG